MGSEIEFTVKLMLQFQKPWGFSIFHAFRFWHYLISISQTLYREVMSQQRVCTDIQVQSWKFRTV